jgi:hypothetical protein
MKMLQVELNTGPEWQNGNDWQKQTSKRLVLR